MVHSLKKDHERKLMGEQSFAHKSLTQKLIFMMMMRAFLGGLESVILWHLGMYSKLQKVVKACMMSPCDNLSASFHYRVLHPLSDAARFSKKPRYRSSLFPRLHLLYPTSLQKDSKERIGKMVPLEPKMTFIPNNLTAQMSFSANSFRFLYRILHLY